MHRQRLWQCVWGIVLVAGAGLSAQAQGVYHNQRLFVVPAPGKVVIDGDLKDWDLSGEIYTYVIEATADVQSARTAMMYDAEALYISGRVADPSPLLNKADPAVNPDFGWDGDAFQFRLCLDPALGYPLKIGGYDRTPNENLVHMALWWHTDSKRPVLHLKHGMDFHDARGYHKGVVPADKFQAAYVPWPDGKGYTFELPKEAVASITLIDAKGDRVRNLIAAQSRPGGKVVESWDGLDNVGRVLPAGEYAWKGLHHEPLKTRYVLAVSNSGSPSYNTPDGKGAWGGDWGSPADICFAGDRGLLVWDGSEAGMGLIGLDAAGREQWGYRVGGSYLATDGQWVFAYLGHEKQIRAYTVADGRQTNFLRGELWAEPNSGKDTVCSGLAWQAGKLYVANAAANEVIEYDAKHGKILRRLSVPPAGTSGRAFSSASPGSLTRHQ